MAASVTAKMLYSCNTGVVLGAFDPNKVAPPVDEGTGDDVDEDLGGGPLERVDGSSYFEPGAELDKVALFERMDGESRTHRRAPKTCRCMSSSFQQCFVCPRAV